MVLQMSNPPMRSGNCTIHKPVFTFPLSSPVTTEGRLLPFLRRRGNLIICVDGFRLGC